MSKLEREWGISPLTKEFWHKVEGIKLYDLSGTERSKKRLDIDVWYENYSVTRGAEPTFRLYCKIAHSLIFGRSRLRNKEAQPPIEQAFSAIENLEDIRMTFFALIYRNNPHEPNQTTDMKDKNSLRVFWKREEKVVPYLTLSVSRGEWKSLSAYYKNIKNEPFEIFERDHCYVTLNLLTRLSSNFEALQKAQRTELEEADILDTLMIIGSEASP